MIDIKLVRENPKIIKESIRKRLQDEKDFNSLLKIDEDWRKAKKDIDELRSKRNNISKKINETKKKNQNINGLLKEAKEIPGKIQTIENSLRTLEKKRFELWKKIPNLVDKSIPVGDAKKNRVLKKHGAIKKKKLAQGHAEILENSGLIDTKKAAQVTGSRFYYLKKDLVKMNYALICFTLDFLDKKKFELIQPPSMLKKEALEGAITLDVFEDAIYKIEGEDLYLIGTAEHSINAFKSNEILNSAELPLRFAGVSSCFRKEAGAHGIDTKGIFRVHQFEKVEQFVFCKPENSEKEFDFLLKNSIELYKKLGIPFRVVVLASGDIGNTATKTIDLEGWYPSQKKYRELGSCSNCLDYQARRSNIRFQEKGETKFVHTLNNTAIATERMMTCIAENNLQKDGSIKIPKVLHKYMGGKKLIKIIKKE